MAGVSRRRLLAAGGAAAVAGSVLGQGVASAQRWAPRSPWHFQVDVAPDMTSFSSVREPASGQQIATGPFYATGALYNAGDVAGDGTAKSGAKRIGTYRLHGWIYDTRGGMAVVTQSFEITGRGEIVAAGIGGGGMAAVVGGTGDFTNGVGQIFVDWINRANFSFRASFDVGTANGNLNQ